MEDLVRPGAKGNLKILSLDGGGIRGLSGLFMLRRMFYRLNEKRRQEHGDGYEDIDPCDYFDLIAGTSTGGIVAVMLGRLSMSIDHCIDLYIRLGTEIFGPEESNGPYRFNAERLEQIIVEAIAKKLAVNGDLRDPRDIQLLDSHEPNPRCKTAAFTIDRDDPNPAEPVVLRSYRSTHEEPNAITVVDAIRATSAGLTYFKPLTLLQGRREDIGRSFIDAGIKFNNPSEEAWNEAAKIWGDDGDVAVQRVGMFLSLGTGLKPLPKVDGDGMVNTILNQLGVPRPIIQLLQSLATDTERVHQSMLKTFRGHPDKSKVVYCRMNVIQALGEIRPEEYDKIPQIRAWTEKYLKEGEMSIKLGNYICRMHECWQIDQNAPLTNTDPRDMEARMAQLQLHRPLSSEAMAKCIKTLRSNKSLLTRGPCTIEPYWVHLTTAGWQMYDRIFRLLVGAEPEMLDFVTFVRRLGRDGPTVADIKKYWLRFRYDPTEPLPKPYVLALLYMLHVEVYSPDYQTERPELQDFGEELALAHEAIDELGSFATWTPCESPADCSLQWNFGGRRWGIPVVARGRRVPQTCLMYARYLDYEEHKHLPAETTFVSRRLSQAQQDESDAIHLRCIHQWYESGWRESI